MPTPTGRWPRVQPPKRLVILGTLLAVLVSICFFTYLGSELRRAYFGLAPINRTIAYSVCPSIDKRAHVYVVPAAKGLSVRLFVYENEPGWVSTGYDLGEIGTASDLHDAAKKYGVVRWTDTGMTVGSGATADKRYLSPEQISSTR